MLAIKTSLFQFNYDDGHVKEHHHRAGQPVDQSRQRAQTTVAASSLDLLRQKNMVFPT